MEFNYYYGTEADQFSFIRIPKAMMTDPMFAGLSLQAKVLYGLLLDRMGLSVKNHWLDENNRVFIIYQIAEIQEDMGYSKKKSMEFLNELENLGLVEKRKRGFGLPSILYVKNFILQEMGTSRGVDLGTSGSTRTVTSRGADLGTSEVPVGEPLSNNTKYNNNYVSNTKSNLIESSEDETEMWREYRELIRDNLEIDIMCERYPYDKETINGIWDLIVEVLLSKNESIVISSDRYPSELVKSRFLKLNSSHLEYVMDRLAANTTKVHNIKKYLLATLFNAPSTMEGYYRAEVNHDFPQYAAR